MVETRSSRRIARVNVEEQRAANVSRGASHTRPRTEAPKPPNVEIETQRRGEGDRGGGARVVVDDSNRRRERQNATTMVTLGRAAACVVVLVWGILSFALVLKPRPIPPPPPKTRLLSLASHWMTLHDAAVCGMVVVFAAFYGAGKKRNKHDSSTETNFVTDVKHYASGFDGMRQEWEREEEELERQKSQREEEEEAERLRRERQREEEEAERLRRERQREEEEEERLRLERQSEEEEEERLRRERQREEEEAEQRERQREAAEAKMRELCKAAERARAAYNKAMEEAGNIRVVCRVRPTLPAEVEAEWRAAGEGKELPPPPFEFDDVNKAHLSLVDRQRYPPIMRQYRFAAVLPPPSTQADVFEEVTAIIDSVMSGVNVTVLAYGQTGSGKTYTMDGSPRDPGLISRTVNALFYKIQSDMPAGSKVRVHCSALEIYLEQIHDLLASNAKSARAESVKGVSGTLGGGGGGAKGGAGKLDVREEVPVAGVGGYVRVHVPGLVELEVSSAEAVEAMLERARACRATAATTANERSSRSHAVTTLHVTVTRPGDTPHRAKLHMVDLAGSERLRDSRAKGEQLKETQAINRSLSALGDVIHSLKSGEAHVPYRNSKLTALLRDSIGGNNKVLVVVACSPLTKSASESMRSLDFAERISETVLGPAMRRATSAQSLLEKEAFRFNSFETVPSSSLAVLSPVQKSSEEEHRLR